MDEVIPLTDEQLNNLIHIFYSTNKVKHFHESGIHTCPVEIHRKYDIVSEPPHPFHSERKEKVYSWL